MKCVSKISLFIFIILVACKKEEIIIEEPIQNVVFEGLWKTQSVLKNNELQSDWDNSTLNFVQNTPNSGIYSSSNSPSYKIWPDSGSWILYKGGEHEIIRDDSVIFIFSIERTNLILTSPNLDDCIDNTDCDWLFALEHN